MANPKLDGYTKESRPYSMTATRALQHLDKNGIIDLEGIDARLPVSATEFATIGAERGVYDRENNTLDIPSPITVKTTDGMTAILQSAYLEIGPGQSAHQGSGRHQDERRANRRRCDERP